MKDHATLLTKGPIMKTMVLFALPILLGNLFQQLYNTVDSLVVGNFVSSAALASVTSTNHIINLTVGFLQGVFIGAGIAVAKYYGAENERALKRAVHTTVAFALLAGMALTVIGVLLTPWLLRTIHTPEDVFPLSASYFRIYYSGIIAVVLYNCAAGILQSVGDSRHPLMFLIISSVLNIVLDLIFVICFGWGVKGAACATVISQAVSALLAFTLLMRADGIYRVEVRHVGFDRKMLGEILLLGIPSGMQNSIISFSNLVIQGHLNTFGTYALAGCGTFFRIEGLSSIVMMSLALATSTYVSQNVGAGEFERAHTSARYSMISCAAAGEAISLLVMFFSPYLIGLFNSEPEVIRYGVLAARIMAPVYCLPALTHSMAAVLRGIGRPVIPMIAILVTWCAARVAYTSIALRICHDIRVLFAVYPFTWVLSAVVLFICCSRINWADPAGSSKSR